MRRYQTLHCVTYCSIPGNLRLLDMKYFGGWKKIIDWLLQDKDRNCWGGGLRYRGVGGVVIWAFALWSDDRGLERITSAS